jgi:tRNA-dihydrouridine synthase A
MAVDVAVLRGDVERLIGFDPSRERPVALQLGGSDPVSLAAAARIGADLGYDEINLNVGCPSDRVQEGRFGACLMREPALVADCVAAMAAAVAVPVTVKHRLGVDDQDPEQSLFQFVETVAAAGVRTFYVHARKAWLDGLSPKDNRTIPPLDYDIVRRLAASRPDLAVHLNGGLRTLDAGLAEASAGPRPLAGVMFGRAAYESPWMLADVDRRVYGAPNPVPSRLEVLDGLEALVAEVRAAGRPAHTVLRHTLGLFHGVPGGRAWRRALSEAGASGDVGPEIVRRAAETALGAKGGNVTNDSGPSHFVC